MIIKSAEKIEKEFRTELLELLNKYHAKIVAENHYFGYSDAGADIRMTILISRYDDGNTIQEYTEIDLGQYFP